MVFKASDIAEDRKDELAKLESIDQGDVDDKLIAEFDLIFVGLIQEGSEMTALFKSKNSVKQNMSLRLGDRYKGWRLHKLSNSEVRLKQGETSLVAKLFATNEIER